MLYILPIEPIEMRYSAQWLNWVSEFIDAHNLNKSITIIDPYHYLSTGTTCKIVNGQFLDAVKTNQYKTQELQQMLTLIDNGKLQDGDNILIMDGWFPGIEMLAYIRDALKIKFNLIAMFHAGTYDPWDYLTQCNMETWGCHIENGWFNLYDKIIVATKFHKDLLTKNRKVSRKKVEVIFFPMYPDWIPVRIKKNPNLVVFPHRLVPEKSVDLIPQLQATLAKNGFELLLTATCKTKQDYWNTLAKAQYCISMSYQETWGIAMIESVLCNCYPIVPNSLSYKELYPQLFKYPLLGNEQLISQILSKILEIDSALDVDELSISYKRALSDLQKQFVLFGTLFFPKVISTLV